MRNFVLTLFSLFFLSNNCYADKVIWSGEVTTDGVPTQPVRLVINESYVIRAQHVVNLGKWVQKGEALANDACYEYSKDNQPQKLETLKNSFGIDICDGSYHADHVYESKPFKATIEKIHFWVNDSYYDDNTGTFSVEVIQVTP